MQAQTHSPRWLVFGGSGAVGRFLLPMLLAQHAEVLALTRAPVPPGVPSLHWLQGSLQAAPALDAVLEAGARFDVVCSLGPLDAFADWLDRHPHAAACRVLALSSLSAEWKQHSAHPAERSLARSLVDNERRVLQQCPGATLLRCGLIHGAGVDRSLSPLLRWARRRPLPWPRAARGLRQPVHAADLARAALAAAARPQLAQRVLALPGPEALSFPVMLQRSLAAEGRRSRVIPVPLPGLEWLVGLLAGMHGRFGARAATVRRLYRDQLSPSQGWGELGIALSDLRRVGDAAADGFQYR